MWSVVRARHLRNGGWPEIANVFGVPINCGSPSDVIHELWGMWFLAEATGNPHTVCLVNAFSLVEAHRNPRHMQALREADLCLADGLGVAVMARTPKIAGADLMLAVARHPQLGKMRHVLLGGFGVAYKAALRQWNEAGAVLECKAWVPRTASDGQLMDWANEIPCDILWVALGCPVRNLDAGK